jgi:aspartate-semialdehyde dehydrogenase
MEIVIVGATGNVGRVVVEIITEKFPNLTVRCTGSKRSAGSKLEINGKVFTVEDTDSFQWTSNQLSIFNTEADISKRYIPEALSAGGYVIDSSSHYRLDSNVPLVVPYISKVDIGKNRLFAHSNCIVSPIASVLHPLHREFAIDRVIASTYQSVSGAGKSALDQCFNETKAFCDSGKRGESNIFPRPIAFNIIPQIGTINNDGIAGEEEKIVKELNKIVDRNIYISATSVRVPVLIGHSISLSMRFRGDINQVKSILSNSPRIKLSNDYNTPIEVVGKDHIFVGRIRSDMMDNEQWFHMWLSSDNLRIGAALDAVYMAEEIIRQKFYCQL